MSDYETNRDRGGGRNAPNTPAPSFELSEEEIAELQGVVNGADIWGYGNAKHLRSIQRKAPHLIEIVPAMQKPPGHQRQPYFGCIATQAGRAYLLDLLGRILAP